MNFENVVFFTLFPYDVLGLNIIITLCGQSISGNETSTSYQKSRARKKVHGQHYSCVTLHRHFILTF